MAFVQEKIGEGHIGGLKLTLFKCTFTSVTEGILKAGMFNVLGAFHTNDTTEADGKLQVNKSAASTASQGDVFCSGFTSNDVAYVGVIGA